MELPGLYSKFNNDLGHAPPHKKKKKRKKSLSFSSKNLAKEKNKENLAKSKEIN